MLLALEASSAGGAADRVRGRPQQEVRVWSPGCGFARHAGSVLIGAPVRLGGTNVGTVAVIAPTRIQYQEMIEAVSYIARLSERLLEIPNA